MSDAQVLEAVFASKSDCLVRYYGLGNAVSVAVKSSVQSFLARRYGACTGDARFVWSDDRDGWTSKTTGRSILCTGPH